MDKAGQGGRRMRSDECGMLNVRAASSIQHSSISIPHFFRLPGFVHLWRPGCVLTASGEAEEPMRRTGIPCGSLCNNGRRLTTTGRETTRAGSQGEPARGARAALFAQAESLNDLQVSGAVLSRQVLQQAVSPADHLEQPAAGGVVLLVG